MQLDKIHALELKIAVEFKRICEKNEIPYFLIGGTLLGAVRHGGFIPWDDDMDIGMLRQDYERFLEACKQDLDPAFFLQTWDTDPEYPFSYGKLRLNGTECVEVFAEHNRSEHKGLFVDIFPFDNVPDDPKEQKKQEKRYFLCKRLLWIKKGMGINMKQQSAKQKVRYYLFKLFACMFRYEDIKAYYRKMQTKYNYLHTQKVVTDGSYGYVKESLERNWTTDLEQITFESEQFLACKDYVAYLEHLYGDYMQLPPVEKRGGHSFKSVNFGIYE